MAIVFVFNPPALRRFIMNTVMRQAGTRVSRLADSEILPLIKQGKLQAISPLTTAKGVDVQADKIKQREEAKEGVYKTLLSFIDNRYDEWAKTHLRRGGEAVKRMKYNFSDLLSKQLSEITKWDLDKWRSEQKKEGKSASTINRDVASLKAALSKAVEWGILPSTPLKALKPLKLDKNAPIRYLSPEEVKSLRDALDDREKALREKRASANSWRRERGYETLPEINEHFADYLKPMVILSMFTGLRRGELFNLKWEDVYFDSDPRKSYLTVQGATAKSQSTRHIPLYKDVISVLKEWQNGSTLTGYVFKNKDGERFNNTKRSWKKLLHDAGINNFRWHDLRHHFASKCVMDGLQLNSVRVLLGHSDIRMTLRYAHLNPTHLAEEINKLT